MDFFHPKLVAFVLVAAVYLLEWKSGRLRAFFSQIRKNGIGFYLRSLLLVAPFVIGMFFLDPVALTFVQDLNHTFFGTVSKWGGILGREANLWLFMISWYFLGLVLKHLTCTAVSFGAILSSSLGSVLCNISKFFFLRARPNTGRGPFSFFNFEAFSNEGGRFYSFPSGDVVVVAGAAYFLLIRTKNISLRAILFFLPLMTAIARMDANKHWPSDTLFSLVLGFISALWVSSLLEEKGSKIQT